MSEAPEAPRGLLPNGWVVLIAGLGLAWHATSGPHVFDAGELAAAAARLGGSHPPGQPLHALLGHAVTLLPFGSMTWRIALLSAAAATAAGWLVGRIASELLLSVDAARSLPVRAAPTVAALATLVAPPVLRQATRVEVYGLALLTTAGAILSLIRWGAARSGGSRWLLAAALLAGLTVSVHPPHALVPLIAGALIAATLRRDLWRRPRVLASAAAACLLGLALTVYLPVRASAGAPMWGEPTHLAGLWDYVSGAAYRGNLGRATDGSLLAHLGAGLGHAALAAGLVPLLGVTVMGARARAARATTAALLVLPAALACAWVIHIDPGIPDASAYAGPAAVSAIAVGCAGIAVAVATRSAPARALGGVALLLAVAHPLTAAHAVDALRQDATVLETLGGALVDTPPPRAVAMVENDFEAATWMLAQAIDGARPDAALFVPGLATSSWHWRSLAPHPLYDGRPVRGRGDAARSAYVDGAFRTAAGRVAVAVGPTPVDGPGTVAGPYRLLWPRTADARPAVWEQAVAERLAPEIGRGLAGGPPGDRGLVAAVVRHHQSTRARRLAARDRVREALGELERAMWPLPASERRLLEGADGTLRGAPPPVVRTPGAFLVTAEQAARRAASILWAAGERERAHALMRARVERGDAAAALQVGWLRLLEGDPAGAREAARVATAEAPELAEQADRLLEAAGGAQ